MQFSVLAILAGAAAVAVATPQGIPAGYDSTTPGNGETGFGACHSNTKISCCNTAQGSNGILGDILGGSCGGFAGFSGDTCDGANTYCCPQNSSGELDISLSCFPISLKLR